MVSFYFQSNCGPIETNCPFCLYGDKIICSWRRSILPSFYKRQILDPSKLEEFADDNSKFDENDRTLSKRVENTVWKGEIAHYEQFLLFPSCFQKTYTADT